jgi:hypothetical protein
LGVIADESGAVQLLATDSAHRGADGNPLLVLAFVLRRHDDLRQGRPAAGGTDAPRRC